MKIDNSNLELGAHNLLKGCAKIQPHQNILFVGEAGSNTYFESELCVDVARIANDLGANSKIILAPPVPGAANFPNNVAEAMSSADTTIFFSRLGDQIRFAENTGDGKKIMCYTLTRRYLAEPFATIDYQKMNRIHDLLEGHILSSSQYCISAPCGTLISGEIHHGGEANNLATSEFYVDLFPVMTFQPINCHRMNGNLILKNFLTSSSTRSYENSVLLIDSKINAVIENSVIIKFEGNSNEIKSVKRQMERAAEITGGNPYRINSWHTGINPGTFFEGNPYDDLEYWGTVAYGSPRYTHFHASGCAPGDVAIHLMDATISFNDLVLWGNGKFLFLDFPEVQSTLNPDEIEKLHSQYSLEIGL